ncbi:MAG: hypothetical protein R8L58_05115 [Mariprofundaceae bacterium]
MYTGVHPLLRQLHIWIGLLILLPVVLISITAIMLAHDKDLGLKDIRLQAEWLPDGWLKHSDSKDAEIKADLAGDAGSALIGTKSGLYYLEGNTLTAVPALQGMDIRSLKHWQGEVLVAARQGAFLSGHGTWNRLYEGDARSIDADDDGNLYVAAHHKGLLISHDGGQSWQVATDIGKQLATLTELEPTRDIELKRLIKGLHSGRILVGKRSEWLWIDTISGLLLFSSLIGVFRWWKKRNIY